MSEAGCFHPFLSTFYGVFGRETGAIFAIKNNAPQIPATFDLSSTLAKRLILDQNKRTGSSLVAGLLFTGAMISLLLLAFCQISGGKPDPEPKTSAKAPTVHAPLKPPEPLQETRPATPPTASVAPQQRSVSSASVPSPPVPASSPPPSAPKPALAAPPQSASIVVAQAKPPLPAAANPPPAPEPAPEPPEPRLDETAEVPPQAVPPEPQPPAENALVPYIDQLIEGVGPKQPSSLEPRGVKGLARYGPGSFGLEYRYFRSKTSGDVNRSITENGLGVTLRQSTPNFGHIDLQAAVTDQSQNPGPDVGTGDTLRLIQTALPLSRSWLMDNSLGKVSATTPAIVASSYRFRLPAATVEGLATRLLHGNTTVSAAVGDLGIRRGRTFPVFERTAGSITGAAATHRFDPSWSGGLQLWDVSDAVVGNTIADHTSLAGALEYRDHVSRQSGQLHFLSTNDGSAGIWLDGESAPGFWQHNYGVFRLDPDLVWIDDAYSFPNDQQGTYWTGTYRAFRWSVRAGADYLETNIDNDPTVTGRETTNSFANLTYRISPQTTIDAALRFIDQRPGAGQPSPEEDVTGVRATVSHRFRNGTSFWTVGVTDSDGGSDPNTVSEFIWEHEWRIPLTRLRTGIEYQRDERTVETLSETIFRVIANRSFAGGRFGLNAIVTAGVAENGTIEENRTSSFSLSFDWRVAPAWQLHLDLNRNRNVAELVGGREIRVTERSAFLGVRYELGWRGQRATVGRSTGKQGQGRISGAVFLDANRNGIQEPDEAGVPNVTVYLDRGFSVITDGRGRYEFWPVPAGDHTLWVTLDNVPLPWGLIDESSRKITVVPRGASQLDYALTKINE